ncbi:MAG TPA: hypothetical protein VIR65_15550 [Rhizorhapis sp.]
MNKDYAEEAAGPIIEQLKQGTALGKRRGSPANCRLPYNAATGKSIAA